MAGVGVAPSLIQSLRLRGDWALSVLQFTCGGCCQSFIHVFTHTLPWTACPNPLQCQYFKNVHSFVNGGHHNRLHDIEDLKVGRATACYYCRLCCCCRQPCCWPIWLVAARIHSWVQACPGVQTALFSSACHQFSRL